MIFILDVHYTNIYVIQHSVSTLLGQVCQQGGVLSESPGPRGGRSPGHPAAALVEGGDHVVVEQQGQQAIQEVLGALAELFG